MTPTEQAARVLADVPRYNPGGCGNSVWLHVDDALAAIARLFAPGDDLVERLLAGFPDKQGFSGYYPNVAAASALMPEAAARISALTATVGELQAEIAKVTSDRAYIIGANAGWDEAVAQGEASPAVKNAMVRFWRKMAERHQAEAATLRDRLARRTAAMNAFLEDWEDELPMEAVADLHRVAVGEWSDAALTDGGSNG